jgi:hypothetical protein
MKGNAMAVVKRTDYWNPTTGGPFTSPTGKGESYTDVEQYFLPVDRLTQAALHGWGVAAGLEVSAAVGGTDLAISIGVAFDAAGRALLLAAAGTAVTDPNDDPSTMLDVSPVTLTQTGLPVTTSVLAPGLTGAALLTLTWREVHDSGQAVLLHAPWVRLVPAAGFQDVGDQVVLAAVDLTANGAVDNLTVGPRRLVGTPTARLELRAPRTTSGTTDVVDESAIGEIRPRPDGGLDLGLLGSGAPLQASLSIAGGTGEVSVTGPFRVRDKLVVDAAGAISMPDRITAGQIAVGTPQPQRIVHIEGSEVHSGGSGGGFSFADRRQHGGFLESPSNGERWVWYADGGRARLWSGKDRLTVSLSEEGGGLDVGRRMRVRQGNDGSAGIWLFQTASNADRGFVGMVDDGRIGLYGNAGAGWGLKMDVATAALEIVGPASMLAGARISRDAVVGAGANGVLSVRHVNGKSHLNDSNDDLFLNWSTGRSVHVGGASEASFEVVGTTWLRRDLNVDGAIFAHTTMTFPNWSGGGIGTWDLFSRGGVYVGNDPANPAVKLWPDGVISGSVKRFAIDHPLDPAHKILHHACLEGAEAAVYYRGTGQLTDGHARVVLPGYFEALTRAEGRTVQVTPLCTSAGPTGPLGATQVSDGGFEVLAGCGAAPDQEFSWVVTAERADIERLTVETDKGTATPGLGRARGVRILT